MTHGAYDKHAGGVDKMSDNKSVQRILFKWVAHRSPMCGDTFGHLLTVDELREVYIRIGQHYVEELGINKGKIPEITNTKGWGSLLYELTGGEDE